MKTSTAVFVIAIVGSSLAVETPAQSKKKVLILGAGVAGITAAKTLHDKGIDDFLVLEGQDYIGGRMKNVPFAGLAVEEGANWIHYYDEEDNPMKALKNKHDLGGTTVNYDDSKMRDNNGTEVTDEELSNTWDEIVEEVYQMGKKRYAERQQDMPLEVALKLLGWTSDTPLKQALSWYYFDFEYAKEEKKVSLENLDGVSNLDYYVVDPQGYWSLFEDFYSDFPEKILLNKTVTKIQYSSEGVQVTAGGQDFRADYALSTFSNGVLASDLVEFEPPLPTWKKEAIYRMPMSYYTRIFLKFPRDFWDDSEWILHVSETRGHYIAFLDYDRPGYLNGSSILLATVTGEISLKVENQDDSQTLEEVMEVLRGMYGDGIPNATDIHVSKWSRNRFTRGSFSDPMIGTDDQTFKNLAGRLDRLFFAGEGTSSAWYGYAQGAYYTGKSQADSIASCNNTQLCEPFVPYTWPDQKCETSSAPQLWVLSCLVGMCVYWSTLFLCCP